MLDTCGKNIRNKELTIKSFLEGFHKLGQNMDYWFWSVCLVELRKNPSNSLPELVNTVARYTASLNTDQIITAVNDIPPRARACIEYDGGAFEYKLKYLKKRLNRYFVLGIFFPEVSNIR